ncbi:MAG: hypothetical protein IJ419_00480 [Agathobacter sp.]|nr:hypothetical protein [Agathobacter sp.]
MEYLWFYMFENLAKALLLTLVLEAPVIWLGLGTRISEGNKRKLIVNFVLINAITNIAFNTLLYAFSLFILTLSGIILVYVIVILELIIPFIEAKMYRYTTNEFSMKRLLVTCYIANIVSFLLGSWIMSIWG